MRFTQTLSKTTFLAFLFMAIVIVACKDDKDEPDPVVDTNPIVGTWQVTAITPETAGTTIPALSLVTTFAPCLMNLKLTFKADNTIATADCPEAVSAIGPYVPVGNDSKWKVDGDKLTLSNSSSAQQFKFTQTATNLTIIVNTNTDATKPPVNALLVFKRI
ncbi:lipocalin-like domain-containing protein [Dyadobacter luticola]|nr:lipocalin family protein [Dyadobacter luticola]